ncbi:unnamed protein product [Amoebophrya sp. A120]|nr:unnamed protein product [Amoebophrya sp. A120]|eukprot:GSA120T00021256001.1
MPPRAKKKSTAAPAGAVPPEGDPADSEDAAQQQEQAEDTAAASGNNNTANESDASVVAGVSVAIDVKFDKTSTAVQFFLALFRHDSCSIEVCVIADSGNFPLLEAVLLQIAVNCDFVINACDPNLPKSVKSKIFAAVKQGVEDEEVMIHETTRGFTTNVKETVQRLRQKLLDPDYLKAAEHSFFDQENLMKAVGGLINCCTSSSSDPMSNSTSISLNPLFHQRCSLKEYTGHQQFLKLDKAAFTALHILPTDKKDTRSPTSLLGFLNKCRTPMGTRRLIKWLRQPLTDEVEILKRHDLVETLVENLDLLQIVQRSLKQVVDLDRLIQKLHRTAVNPDAANGASLDDLYAIWRCLQSALHFMETIDQAGHDNEDGPMRVHFLNPFEKVLQQFSKFIQMIETTVDMETAHDIKKRVTVNPNFDPKFKALRAAQAEICAKMDAFCLKVSEFVDPGSTNTSVPANASAKAKAKAKATAAALQDSDGSRLPGPVQRVEHTIREEKIWAMRVVKKWHSKLQQQKERYSSLSLKKAEFLFTTAEMTKWNEELKIKDTEYEHAQQDLVKRCCKIASTFIPPLEKFSDHLATIDVLAAFALVATCSQAEFVRPRLVLEHELGEEASAKGTSSAMLNQQRRLKLTKCTHPLVQENESTAASTFVPNDCHMCYEEGRFICITGPNMGGKSTFIRQVAISVLLNQIGMYVPAETAEMVVFSSIFARVGASDAQLKGISTFMAEMLESSTILQAADERSLVIVDELGRGTSTQDGYGLAYAIAKYLCAEKQCFTLFATHFHELGELQYELGDAVQNKHAVALVEEEKSKSTSAGSSPSSKQAAKPQSGMINTKLTFLYEMKPGVADQSYGVHVAKLAKFPDAAVSSAKRTADFLERRAKKKLKLDHFAENDHVAGDEQEEADDGKLTKLLSLFQASTANEFAQNLLSGYTKEQFLEKVLAL